MLCLPAAPQPTHCSLAARLERSRKMRGSKRPFASLPSFDSMTLRIYNTLTRALEDFAPIEPGHVRMYVCGMTVYDLCHLGHARSMVAFDVVQRWLGASGLRVTYVRCTRTPTPWASSARRTSRVPPITCRKCWA